MFSITAIPLAIEQLNSELELALESAAKEAPGDDQPTREIELTPELMSLVGDTSMLA